MKIISKVTGKEYDSDNVIYILNPTQFKAYMFNSSGDNLVDIIPDVIKKKITYVFLKNDETYHLYELWNKHQLPY